MHVAYRDAEAYAKWAGKELPTEAEWEFAARGGLDGAEFAWGDEFTPGGRADGEHLAGRISRTQNLAHDGYERTSPVTAFPPNGYGLHDMIGNVWEWTTDWYAPKHEADAPKACCIPENPRGGREDASYDPCQPADQDSAQGAERRLASVRAELLPALPSGRAPRRAGRYLDQPCRLSLRHPRREAGGMTVRPRSYRANSGRSCCGRIANINPTTEKKIMPLNRSLPLQRLALAAVLALALPAAPNVAQAQSLSAEEAQTIGVDAYLYFYPLVTMDITRKQLTNSPAGRSAGR